jgi:hypothetical protein
MNYKIIPLLVAVLLLCSCKGKLHESAYLHPILKPDHQSCFSNGGWKYDRYDELESLDAGKSIVIADLEGPGIITHIHTTRHRPEELMSRGIVLIIYFDDTPEPSVYCPLADFFGDGCNGMGTMNFSSNLAECAPWSYNSYFQMPFKKSAKVILRNDTEKDAMNYSYVEWEKIPGWKKEYGYFHATYRRISFQLDKSTDISFFKVKGMGHVLGRQFSITTDDPVFRGVFYFIMEGNNEIYIDGKERVIDYLGTEDSFTFSWGFNETFAGLHAGMPLIQNGDTSYLSLYRFHDHMPIRFNHEFEWKINWEHEFGGKQKKIPDRISETIEKGEGFVDYATVFYWYLSEPGGYLHDSLAPVPERIQRMIKTRDL